MEGTATLPLLGAASGHGSFDSAQDDNKDGWASDQREASAT